MHEKRKDTGVKQQIVREKKGEYSIDKAAQPQKDMMLKKKHQKRIVRANLNPGNQTKPIQSREIISKGKPISKQEKFFPGTWKQRSTPPKG